MEIPTHAWTMKLIIVMVLSLLLSGFILIVFDYFPIQTIFPDRGIDRFRFVELWKTEVYGFPYTIKMLFYSGTGGAVKSVIWRRWPVVDRVSRVFDFREIDEDYFSKEVTKKYYFYNFVIYFTAFMLLQYVVLSVYHCVTKK